MTRAQEQDAPGSAAPLALAGMRARFPARPAASGWPATTANREETLRRLTSAPFASDSAGTQKQRVLGLTSLLDWLEDQPGDSWQDRWLASGADSAGRGWREVPAGWLASRGQYSDARLGRLSAALLTVICADVVRPGMSWFAGSVMRGGHLVTGMQSARDAEGFARLRELCGRDPNVSPEARAHVLHRGAVIVGAKGGLLRQITVGDVIELLDAESSAHAKPMGHGPGFYRILHQMGILDASAPQTLRELTGSRQRTPAELVDRYDLACRPVRDLLVDYLKERQPALDYSSLRKLSAALAGGFWKDLERHHPGISSLHLPAQVSEAWKQRLRSRQKTIVTSTGAKAAATVERTSYRQCLTPVRAFYLDLAQWAIEEPGRWAAWAVPCPVGAEEINQRKAARHRKSRMDARTRERLPVLPVLVRAIDERRKNAGELLQAARRAHPGETFTTAGQTLTRSVTTRPASGKIWADDPVTGKRRDLAVEEDLAFWAWAAVEVLRLTGVRVEELLELSHHSLVQYRLPTTGELIPLLQIVPSKTDTERLLVVSPELADVLSVIIRRIRGGTETVPLVRAYDRRECLWIGPAPLLFQRRFGADNRRICDSTIRNMLNAALAVTGLTDHTDGSPLHYSPHDFRRIFITDAIMSGLPPHIAQIIAGHRDLNVTMGYKAVYPDEAIQAHLAFLARRRSLRPSEEYRVPTDEEWTEFLGHFELRKVATGTCGRAFGTPCIHEHSCLRCSMHWPSPAQRPRIAEIRDNLIARIAEAEREGWHGEAEGLKISLAGARDKLAQIDRRSASAEPVTIGMPAFAPAVPHTGEQK
jgi:integrase-like protein